jgi:hypothetical protein
MTNTTSFCSRLTQRLFLPAALLTCLTVGTGSSSPKAPAFTVFAQRYWNHTGYSVEAGATYELAATGIWYDASTPSGPDGYPRGNYFQNLVSGFRRSPCHQWFALIGTLDGSHNTQFLIGSHVTYTAPRSGEIVCYANDVPGFYWNNEGSVNLMIDRIK